MDTGTVALAIPIAAILISGLVAITAMMSHHQRKMAELYRKDVQSPQLLDEVRAVRAEVAELRDRVNQQMLMSDQGRPRPAVPQEDVQSRLQD
jgi:hypothetical protein